MNIHIIQDEANRKHAFQIRKTVFIDEQHVSEEEELDEHDDQSMHFLGIIKDEPIAASRLRFVGEYGKLERICVLPTYRGQSFGKQLIRFMEKTISDNGYSMAKLNAQTHAKQFYEGLGYKTVSDTFLDAGIPHVTMTKRFSEKPA